MGGLLTQPAFAGGKLRWTIWTKWTIWTSRCDVKLQLLMRVRTIWTERLREASKHPKSAKAAHGSAPLICYNLRHLRFLPAKVPCSKPAKTGCGSSPPIRVLIRVIRVFPMKAAHGSAPLICLRHLRFSCEGRAHPCSRSVSCMTGSLKRFAEKALSILSILSISKIRQRQRRAPKIRFCYTLCHCYLVNNELTSQRCWRAKNAHRHHNQRLQKTRP